MIAQFHPYSRKLYLRQTLNIVRLIFVWLATVSTVHAFDLWTEQNITNNLKPTSGDQIVQLDVGRATTVLSLYRKSTPAKFRGTVLLLHNFGLNPDAPPINLLRLALPEDGWSTLSVAVPQLDQAWQQFPNVDLVDEIRLRINAATKFISPSDKKPLAILAHGFTSLVVLNLLVDENPLSDIAAFVGLSVPTVNEPVVWGSSTANIEKLKLPMLDVYAEFDLDSVVTDAPNRLNSAKIAFKLIENDPKLVYSKKIRNLDKKKRENVWYRQVMIPNVDGLYSTKPMQLEKSIRGWLDTFVENQVANRD